MKTISILLTLVLIVLVAWSCSSLDPIAPGPVNTGSVSFSKFFVIGDNYTAGLQNGGLVEGFQKATWAAAIVQATQTSSYKHEFPNISENGIPQTMYVSDYSGPVIDVLPTLGTPTNTTYGSIYNNLGVPGATLNQLINQNAAFPQQQNPFFAIVLRNPALGSAVTQATSIAPTFLAVWAGWTDAFGGATKGTDLALTPIATFEADYTSMMDSFVPSADAIVAATIPDFDDVPYFTTIPPIVVDPVTRQPVIINDQFVPLIGIVNGTAQDLRLDELVLLPAASLMSLGYGIPSSVGGQDIPLPDSVIVDHFERPNITGTIGQYNDVINTVCGDRGIPVVDMVALFDKMKNVGYELRGETYTSSFLSNSLFGVDGLHPNSLGYYVIALEFIKVINSSFGAAIPQPAVPLGLFRDPALGATNPAAAAASITPEEWQPLLRLFDSGTRQRRP